MRQCIHDTNPLILQILMFLYVTDLTMMKDGDKFTPRSDHARLRKLQKAQELHLRVYRPVKC